MCTQRTYCLQCDVIWCYRLYDLLVFGQHNVWLHESIHTHIWEHWVWQLKPFRCAKMSNWNKTYMQLLNVMQGDPPLQQCGFFMPMALFSSSCWPGPPASPGRQQLSTVVSSWQQLVMWTHVRMHVRMHFVKHMSETPTANKKSNHWEILGFPIW